MCPVAMVLTKKEKKRKQQLQLNFWSNYEVKIASVACVVYTDYIEE